jgi:hypothetical protein
VISTDAYKKSSFSESGTCVEVRLLEDGMVAVRDSKDITKPPHTFTLPEWRAFVAGVRAGEFDV